MKLNSLLRACAFVFICGVGGQTNAAVGMIDLTKATGAAVLELNDFSATPDSHGDLAEFTIQTPSFKRGFSFGGRGWPLVSCNPAMTVFTGGRFNGIGEGGQFMLLELESGGWLAMVPIASEKAFAWFKEANGLKLVVGNFGKEPFSGILETIAYAKAANPYEAMHLCWKAVADHPRLGQWLKLREAKPYPEMFKYLGWCSWEQYRGMISESVMAKAIQGIEASGLPVRYVLMDDGHYEKQTLLPHPQKFPKGYQSLLDLRKPDKVRWMGIWWSLYGETHGVDAPGNLGALTGKMWTSHSQEMLPLPGDASAAQAFYDYMLTENSKGFDFIKIDFEAWPLSHYAGLQKGERRLPWGKRPVDNSHACANPCQASVVLTRAMHEAAEKHFHGLMDCNSIAPWTLFQTRNSSLARCSMDYKVGNLKMGKSHIHESYRIIPWLGQVVWGDHDMFHSSDPFMARLMAVMKALSGGPVYLSDKPEDFKPEVIRPLCYEDGLLLRPLAPAAPVPDDLFFQENDKGLYRVMAPLANRCASIAVYNLQGDMKDDKPKFATTITSAHYAAAPSMIQPYSGNWPVPAEGLLCYDVYGKTVNKVGEGLKVEIEGVGDRLYQISPIQNGWAIVGRTDKYLPAAGVEVLANDAKQLKMRLHEAGPFAIWLEKGRPTAAGIEFVEKGGGLFEAAIPIKPGPLEVTVGK